MTKTPRELFNALLKIPFSMFKPKPTIDAVTTLMLATITELEDLKERVQIIEDKEALSPTAPGWPRARPDGV